MSPRTPEVVVAGYASLDIAVHANRLVAGSETAILTDSPVRPATDGGCAPNVARILARLGARTGLITWLGDDADGRAYRDRLAAEGIDVTGVELGSGPSPRSILIYDPAGDAACYFHPSGSRAQQMTPAACEQVRRAAWLALTVGPPHVTRQLLDASAPDARIAWGVKADPVAFPPELCERLAAADLVCLNRGELGFVETQLDGRGGSGIAALRARGAGWVTVTRGLEGWAVHGDVTVSGPAEAVATNDPTGAGDAFFAGLIAARLRDLSAEDAGRFAASVAAAFLRGELRNAPEAVM